MSGCISVVLAAQDNINAPLTHLSVARFLPLLATLTVSRGDTILYSGNKHLLMHLVTIQLHLLLNT